MKESPQERIRRENARILEVDLQKIREGHKYKILYNDGTVEYAREMLEAAAINQHKRVLQIFDLSVIDMKGRMKA